MMAVGILETGVTAKWMEGARKFGRMVPCATMENGREDSPFDLLRIHVEDGNNRWQEQVMTTKLILSRVAGPRKPF